MPDDDVIEHECTPPDEDVTIVFYTCPCGRTWLRDRDDPTRWQPIDPQPDRAQ